jgi:hypothetical protein
MKQPKPLSMWVAVISGNRSRWMHPATICRTRRETRDAYLAKYAVRYWPLALRKVTFERVTVSVDGTVSKQLHCKP